MSWLRRISEERVAMLSDLAKIEDDIEEVEEASATRSSF